MTPDFEYFSWGFPAKDKPLFALYDNFDNHFMILSYDHAQLFLVRKLIRSKTLLDIVELTNVPDLVEQNLLDNSVIENWGLESVHHALFDDAAPRRRNQNDSDSFYNSLTIKDPTLKIVESNFDEFKLDLQKQLFFLKYCLENTKSDFVVDQLREAVELGKDYTDTVDRFLDLSSIASNKHIYREMLAFLRSSSLYYE